MKERILAYRKKVDQILECPGENMDWETILREHLVQVGFFQHERLIHLIVTVTFAVLFVMSIGIALIAEYYYMFLVSALVLVLLIPYIAHYYLLENEVQTMYRQYDKIMSHIIDKKI
ncbi:MAG: hypothetical protein SPF70_08585 [Lachnospiraceae bacterium]|nr:hypothetical protein [Lachnospiraceae bacterium]